MAVEDAIWALGCMSGTSMDGVDAAMVLTDGIEVFEFGATGYRPYSPDERKVIGAAMGKWPGEIGIANAASLVDRAHIELISRFGGVELVGYHGQTLAHDPKNNRTHQIGDGEVLSTALSLPVAWDFRSADIAAGGQGAPLAPFFHFALAQRLSDGPVAFLNLGGVGNVTFVNTQTETPDRAGALLAFDTGPANAPMDDFTRARTGLACDYGGALASIGTADKDVVARFMGHDYFLLTPPKSLDRNDFTNLWSDIQSLSDSDGLATLLAATIASVKHAFRSAPFKVEKVLICGGGRKNIFLMDQLTRALGIPIVDVDQVGFDGDMLEAQAFAFLAVRARNGMTISAPSTTGVPVAMTGGRIATV